MGIMHHWSILKGRNPLVTPGKISTENQFCSKAIQTPHRPQPDRAAAPIFLGLWHYQKVKSLWLWYLAIEEE